MTPQEAKGLAEFLLADFSFETQATMAVLGAVPAGKLGYQPDPKAKTALG